jgi:hypothetical protein
MDHKEIDTQVTSLILLIHQKLGDFWHSSVVSMNTALYLNFRTVTK